VDLGHLLFNPNGRIGQKDFCIGVAIIVGANLFLTWVPFLGGMLWLVLIWVGVAVYGKRLHDIGKSAWLHAVPWGLSILLSIILVVVAGGAAIAAFMAKDDITSFTTALGASIGMFVLTGIIGSIVWLAYTIWLAVSKGEVGGNIHGQALVIEAVAQTAAPARTTQD